MLLSDEYRSNFPNNATKQILPDVKLVKKEKVSAEWLDTVLSIELPFNED